jgi:hypothetical protein
VATEGARGALLAIARCAADLTAVAEAAPAAREAFVVAFAAATRRLGTAPVVADAAARAALAAAGVQWPASGFGHDELGRIAMLLAAATRLPAVELASVVEDCYRHGDTREREAVLRALALLPAPERFLALALDACRSHVQPVFEAVACENPYPAAHFPAASFNQMVLKALFTGAALARIIGLEGRRTPELARMAADYASERRAAGRSVPADVALLTGASEPT